jgi:hypothetical protein
MFIFIMDRFNSTHIVDFKNNQGKYRTICGKYFFQNIVTLGADNTFNGICKSCKRYYDEMYFSDLEEVIRMARSTTTDYSSFPEFHRYNFMGPRANYEMTWDRSWGKLSKARSFLKHKNYKYYGK